MILSIVVCNMILNFSNLPLLSIVALYRLFVFLTEPQTIEAAALYDFEGRKGRELSFKKHDTLLLYRRVSQDWWEGLYQGKKGLIPDRYITLKHP